MNVVDVPNEGQDKKQQITTRLVLEVQVIDLWTLSLKVPLEAGMPPVTAARTQITQPQGYSQTMQTKVAVKDRCAAWTLTYPLCDEGTYRPMNRRCDWHMGDYRFDVDVLAGDTVAGRATARLSPLNFMPHEFRGVGPLIGMYKYHIVECAPDRPVYIDEDTMGVSFRAIPDRVARCAATMDVVKVGDSRVLAGPWDVMLTQTVDRQTFSTAGWPRGEYWVRLRLHKDDVPVGAYMVRTVWKEILPPEKQPGLRPLDRFQPVAGPWGYSRVQNVRFDSDPMRPTPDHWIVEKEKPWETEFLSISSEIRYKQETGQYSLDILVNDVNIYHPVTPITCRIVSDDGVHWRRPNLGGISYQGTTDNNIVGYPGVDGEGKPTWPIQSFHEARVEAEPELLPDMHKLSIRFYDLDRDGAIAPKHCFVKTTGWDLLEMCTEISPEVSTHFSDDLGSPEHNRFQAYAIERRGNELLLLSREPLLRQGSGMDLYHTTESFRYTLEDTSTGTYYYYFRPGAPSYPPHYSPIDNIHQIRRVLAVMWTRDYLHWERRFVMSPDEGDSDGTQFYHIYLHTTPDEASQSSPGAILAGIPAVAGGQVYFGSVSNYDAHRSQMWPELLWTADFLHWQRFVPRRKMIPNSPPGAYSSGAIRHSGVFTEIGDAWWMTFHAYRLPYKYPRTFRYDLSVEEYLQKHTQFAYAPDFENWQQFYQFCKDGYGINPAIAVAAAGRLSHAEPAHLDAVGELVTMPVLLAGGSLGINAATEAGGSVRVELLDVGGQPLPGHELAVCQPMMGDKLRHVVTWNGRALAALAQVPVRIRFVLDKARLYGYGSI